MRNEEVARIAAVGRRPQMAGSVAQVFGPRSTARTHAAAYPWIDGIESATLQAAGIGSRLLDDARYLMAESEGEAAPLPDVKLLALSKIEMAVLQVHIAVAHAAAVNAKQHLPGNGLRH